VILVASSGSIADTLHDDGSLTVDTNAYELALNQGAGSLSVSTLYVYAPTVAASDQSLPVPTPPADDNFTGWFTAASGGTQVSDSTALSTLGTGPQEGSLYAQYQATVQPTTITGQSQISLNPLAVNIGIVTATLTSSGGTPLGGQTVVFNAGNTVLCTSTTNASGVASCSLAIGDELAILAYLGYSQSFAGNADYLASSSHTALITP
jgi:hypothetical protein